MKKFLTVLILIVVLTFALGCSQKSDSSSSLESNYFSLGQNVFTNNYSITLFDFGQIVKAASEAKSDSDIAYISGRIDGFSRRGIFIYSQISNMDKTYLDKIITPELQSPILNLPNDLSMYLKNLQTNVINTKDLIKLNEMNNDFKDLYELERNINNDMFRTKEGASQYKESIQQIEQIIKSTKWNE